MIACAGQNLDALPTMSSPEGAQVRPIAKSVLTVVLLAPLTAAAAERPGVPQRPRAEDVTAFLAELRTATSLTEPVPARLATAATSALRAPASYFRTHTDDFYDRGIEKPQPDLYVYVLLDGLREAKVVAALDWKTRWEDVLSSIDGVSGERGFSTAGRETQALDTETALGLIAAQLIPRGKRLVHWKMDEDAYYLLVVREAAVPGVIRAAKRLDIVITPVAPAR
jgi:hypothetical protein